MGQSPPVNPDERPAVPNAAGTAHGSGEPSDWVRRFAPLIRPGGRGGAEIAIRFPLHPDCRATLAQSGDSVLIVPPTGEPWRFRASLSGTGERLALEPALYMGGETVRKTEAITVRSALSGAGQTMRWAFHREVPHLRPRRRLV